MKKKKVTAKKKTVIDAPYVETDRSQLGDKHLNPEEAVIREREDLLRIASRAKVWGQEELEDPERGTGARLAYTEVLRRLRNCNNTLLVVDGTPGSVAVYRPKRWWEYDPEQVAPGGHKHDWYDAHVYVTGMPKQDLPEYAYVDLDTSHLATREHRGWRSVLIACIKAGVITYEQAIKEFGDPSFDQRSGRWMYEVAKYRKH